MNRHAPLPNAAVSALTLANARIVARDRIIEGALRIEEGRFAAVVEGADVPAEAIDCEGDFLVPGLVDIHTDHFEKHVFPRAHVRWDVVAAAMAHDAQIIGAGITTVFDSLCVGSAGAKEERREILKPMVEAIRLGRLHAMFRADHYLHLRCEIVDPETPALMDEVAGHDFVKVVSVMDHTPGQRQSRDVEAWLYRQGKATGQPREALITEMEDTIARAKGIGAKVRAEVVRRAQARGLPLLSHDDTTRADVDEAIADGVAISEFPTTIEAAEAARAAGLLTVAGAPNYLRGGSQSGNVAVRDLLERGLVDMLASDYVPRAMLDAAFRIGEDASLPYDLPAAMRMVSLMPARAGGLTDRGEIAEGQRADVLRIRRAVGHVVIAGIWRAGERVM